MDENSGDGSRYLTVRRGQPLIGIPFQEGDEWVVRYFASEADADAFVKREMRTRKALAAIGAWDDVDFDEMLDALDEIRHRNPPTPPIESDL